MRISSKGFIPSMIRPGWRVTAAETDARHGAEGRESYPVGVPELSEDQAAAHDVYRGGAQLQTTMWPSSRRPEMKAPADAVAR
jgi:hypothetical protein